VWNASGWGDASHSNIQEAMELAVECVGAGESRYFVEAELDIPEVKSVSASSVEMVS